jgi:hypothetical protein
MPARATNARTASLRMCTAHDASTCNSPTYYHAMQAHATNACVPHPSTGMHVDTHVFAICLCTPSPAHTCNYCLCVQAHPARCHTPTALPDELCMLTHMYLPSACARPSACHAHSANNKHTVQQSAHKRRQQAHSATQCNTAHTALATSTMQHRTRLGMHVAT